MGITISSENYECDMGYNGFRRFRCKVASLINAEVKDHYNNLEKAMFLFGEGERTKFFKEYDAKTDKLVEYKKLSNNLANFLYQSDCEGEIDNNQAKEIYELIKDCDDNEIYGYTGRGDCATMLNLKDIFNNGTKVNWD